MDQANPVSFETPRQFYDWLETHHADTPELWIKLYKAASGRASVTWEQAVIEALKWGWVDAIKKSYDDESWLQRFTPRTKRSKWSARNRDHVERLIAASQMQPPGLAAIDAAKADGRWDAAYAGQSHFEIQPEFLTALAKNPVAQAQFDTLNRKNLFAIYYRVHSAKKPETRQRRTGLIIAALARGETLV